MAKFCGQCGTEIKEDAAFFPNCGAPCHADIRQAEQAVTQPKQRKKKRHVVIVALCICL